MKILQRLPLVSLLAVCPVLWAQSAKPQQPQIKNGDKPDIRHLAPVETIVSAAEIAGGFSDPIVCDEDGNIYLSTEDVGEPGVRKINPKGERVAVFKPASNPDVKVGNAGYFAVAQDGEVYQLVFSSTEMTRYVVVFRSDGAYKTIIKLDPPFGFIPYAMGLFPSGNLLITGQRYQRGHPRGEPLLPFTGIFSSDGTLLKELNLDDDSDLDAKARSGNSRFTSAQVPESNRAVNWSQMQYGSDGNIYLMRWVNPAIFYAVSPGGAVVRRFTMDPGDPNYQPASMHVTGNRIAVLFSQAQTYEKIMKVVDVEGNEIATYSGDEPNKVKTDQLGAAFACYTSKPERFTFLTTDADKLELRLAAAR